MATPEARASAWRVVIIVVDNATSHPEQMAPFIALVKADAEFTTSLVPIGKGEFLAVKAT